MKKLKYLLIGFFFLFVGVVEAEAASLSVTSSATNVVVGNTITVTVKMNTSGGAAGWEYCLNYDNSVFTYTGSNSLCVLGGTLAGNTSVSFKFKAKASGFSTFSLRDVSVLDDSANKVATSLSSVTVRARTQAEIEASYSKNANLKSLSVEGYEITPSFNKETLEYNLEVENEVESVNISALKEDNAASVTGAGQITLTEGLNKIEIVVTAEKGNKKTYILNITRKELNPIFVDVEGKTYSVVRKADALEAPNYYSATTTLIDDIEVPAFTSDITKYTLVGLKDTDGNINLYIYNDNSYTLYRQIGKDSFTFIPIDNTELIDSYTISKKIIIDDISVNGYYKEGTNEDFVLIYGMNAATGNSDWYQYDVVEGTFQRFQSKEIIKLQDDLSDYFLMVIVFASGLGLSIVLIIFLLIINSKNKKKNIKLLTILENGQKVNKNLIVEDVTEKNEESDVNLENELSDIDIRREAFRAQKNKENELEKANEQVKESEEIEVEEVDDNEEPAEEESETAMLERFNKISDVDETMGMDKIIKEETALSEEKNLSRRELRKLNKDSNEKADSLNGSEVKKSLNDTIKENKRRERNRGRRNR